MSLLTSVLTGTKHIPLSGGGFAIVDTDDYEKLANRSWKNSQGRAIRTKHEGYIGGKRQYSVEIMHRIIMDAPKGMDVDHINGNPLDNRKTNLRICTHQENTMNSRKQARNKTGFKGVTFDSQRNKFLACIRFMGKTYNLGRFDNAVDAALAYNYVAPQLFGQFAQLNEIGEK